MTFEVCLTGKTVGFWADTPEGHWPVARPLPLDSDTKLFLEKLAEVEETKAKRVQYKGYSWCRVCDKDNGSAEFYFGDYCWPQGYSHYIQEHNVAVDPDFFDFIINYANYSGEL